MLACGADLNVVFSRDLVQRTYYWKYFDGFGSRAEQAQDTGFHRKSISAVKSRVYGTFAKITLCNAQSADVLLMMSPNQNLLIVLPAYNEAESLPALLQALDEAVLAFGLRASILVVNDGSQDDTAIVARAFQGQTPVEVFDQIPNQGLAQAMRTGFRLARERLHPKDLILVMDADNTHPAGLMGRMVQTIFEGAELVIASRYQTGARVVGLSRFRIWLSLGASWLFRLRVGLPGVRDYTCGYRVYRCSLLFRAMDRYGDTFIQQRGFACMAEILMKLKPFRPIIVEVPMILRYDLKGGDSKMRIWRTIRQTLRMLAGG